MNLLTALMRAVDRGITGAMMIVGLGIVGMAFYTSSHFRSAVSQEPTGSIELARPLSDPTMGKAYRIGKRSGDIKSPDGKLTDREKYFLNQLHASLKEKEVRSAMYSSFDESSDEYYDGPSDSWGN